MLARIPVALLEQEGLRLLTATRHISQGRDLPWIEEPDNPVRAKIWLACIEQGAGAAGTRKVSEPVVDVVDVVPGSLRPDRPRVPVNQGVTEKPASGKTLPSASAPEA